MHCKDTVITMMTSGAIDSAVKTLWATPGCPYGDEALRILKEAADNGDGDACYFLARCYMGKCYVDPKFGFESNDSVATKYLDKSILLGSALGMLASIRVGDYTPPDGCRYHAPYNSIEEVWDVVYSRAQQGEMFCQLVIANAYYYGDVMFILGEPPKSYKEMENNERKWLREAIPLYENCVAAGIASALNNLYVLLKENPGIVPDSQKRLNALAHLGAKMGIGCFEAIVGCEYRKNNQPEQALPLLKSALSHGTYSVLFDLGMLYTYDGGLPLDLNTAASYFDEGKKLDPESTGCPNQLGKIYFYGGENFPTDYEKAVSNFILAHDLENDWGADMLGTCYLKGLGTNVDYKKAKEVFDRINRPIDSSLAAIGLGEIYAYGLGVEPNIKKGMEFWSYYPKDPRVIENKKHFKYQLFKGWVRID